MGIRGAHGGYIETCSGLVQRDCDCGVSCAGGQTADRRDERSRFESSSFRVQQQQRPTKSWRGDSLHATVSTECLLRR